jgi:glycosyltransferase involved in cell wall biosynthesis
LKLLFLIHSLSSGGAERVLSILANYWAEQGWEVTIATMTSSQSDFYAIDDRIIRHELNLATDSSNPVAAMINNVKRVMAVRKLLRSTRPDVAISMMTTANILLALASIGNRQLVTIGSERTHPPNAVRERFWEIARKYTYQWLSVVVVLSDESAKWLLEHTNARHVTTIPNPAVWPLPTHPPIIEPPIKADGQYFLLTVGRLSPEKGYDLLIQAFAQMAPQVRHWTLIIVGDGPQRDELENQIAAVGLNDRIVLAGRCGNLGSWYQSADLYALTSRFEGFPNTVVEAMAHGLPVVSFDCTTGPRDIIRNNIDGVLVTPEDVAQLTTTLRDLMQNHVKREQLAKRAIEVKDRFTLMRVVQQWEDLMSDLGAPTAVVKAESNSPDIG